MPFSCGICAHFGSDDSGIPSCLHNGDCERGEAFIPKAKEEKKLDIIEKAPHYNMGEFETIDVIKDSLTPEEYRGFLKGSVNKYTLRERYKGGLQDLKKIQYYIKKLIGEWENGKQG
jgi:hypothetical protein